MALRVLTNLLFLVVDGARCWEELVLLDGPFYHPWTKGKDETPSGFSRNSFQSTQSALVKNFEEMRQSTMYFQDTPPGRLSIPPHSKHALPNFQKTLDQDPFSTRSESRNSFIYLASADRDLEHETSPWLNASEMKSTSALMGLFRSTTNIVKDVVPKDLRA